MLPIEKLLGVDVVNRLLEQLRKLKKHNKDMQELCSKLERNKEICAASPPSQ